MLSTVKLFVQEYFGNREETSMDDTEALHFAAAMLFVEVMYADHKTNEKEERAVRMALANCFTLTDDEVEKLLLLAKEKAQDVTSLYEYTSTIHRGLSLEDKIRIVEQIWTIILADNEIDKHEEQLVRRIADLLHLRHSEFIRAKHRVQEQMNQ